MKQKKEEKKDGKVSQVNNGEGLTGEQKAEDSMHAEEDEEAKKNDNSGDARLGTLNRLTALFKFSKLNRKSYVLEEEEDNEEKVPKPPPLPPKPKPGSPIMKNIGTKVDI